MWPEHVIGEKYVRLLEIQLRVLRDGNSHGNRQLFLDDIFVVYLLAFLIPWYVRCGRDWALPVVHSFKGLFDYFSASKHVLLEFEMVR